jgi:DNA helicase II / ATP-dependent DNA helicase PcrA
VIYEIPEQQTVINCEDRFFLVTARPGRGKTTVALLYAQRLLREGGLHPSQKVLFLTFSRNAVYQIATAKKKTIDPSLQERLHVATYHSFMWWLISNFGRFIGLPPRLDLIWETKAQGVCFGSGCDIMEIPTHMACQAHGITYDCFAPLGIKILASPTLRRSLGDLFPVVVIDEFQDTNDEQWEFIKLISEHSRLCSLADPDQMIHRFRGATDGRVTQFTAELPAREYRLQEKCMRTDDHEILDFAEAILDGKQGSAEQRATWKERFLKDYRGRNSASYWLKLILVGFYKDYKTRLIDRPPAIAFAAFANKTASFIRAELQKDHGTISKTFHCSILEPDQDESIEDLILHLSSWFLKNSRDDLCLSCKIIASLLALKNLLASSGPIQSLFLPERLLSGERRATGCAKHVMESLKESAHEPKSITDVLNHSIFILNEMGTRIKSLQGELDSAGFKSRSAKLVGTACQCKDGTIEAQLSQLKNKIRNERLQRCILDTLVPVKGVVATTMHKLKGKEFDYVAVLAMYGDKFYSSDETDLDAKRLLYVSLTRARFDARILYVGSAPPPLIVPYL